MFHAIFENIKFDQIKSYEPTVKKTLAQYGFQAKWQPVLTKWLTEIVQEKIIGELQLKNINYRRNEIRFCFPLQNISQQKLTDFYENWQSIFPTEYAKRIKKTVFPTHQGILLGFIDCFFEFNGKYYLLDWKSNRLGTDLTAYSEQAMQDSVFEHAYFLQSHIYSVALCKYLAQSIPNFNLDLFGGSIYVFLRGLDAKSPGSGVWFDRPKNAFICNFENFLTGSQRLNYESS